MFLITGGQNDYCQLYRAYLHIQYGAILTTVAIIQKADD